MTNVNVPNKQYLLFYEELTFLILIRIFKRYSLYKSNYANQYSLNNNI